MGAALRSLNSMLFCAKRIVGGLFAGKIDRCDNSRPNTFRTPILHEDAGSEGKSNGEVRIRIKFNSQGKSCGSSCMLARLLRNAL